MQIRFSAQSSDQRTYQLGNALANSSRALYGPWQSPVGSKAPSDGFSAIAMKAHTQANNGQAPSWNAQGDFNKLMAGALLRIADGLKGLQEGAENMAYHRHEVNVNDYLRQTP